MHDDKFDPKTNRVDKDLLDYNQRSFMSDTIDQDVEANKPPPKQDKSIITRVCWCFDIDVWKEHFDVTEGQIAGRLFKAVFPFSGEPLFENGKPDLYGPLWIFITLNICLAIFGYLSACIDRSFQEGESRNMLEIHKIATAYGFLMFYFTFIPAGLYFLLKFLMIDEAPEYAKVMGVYGYSM